MGHALCSGDPFDYINAACYKTVSDYSAQDDTSAITLCHLARGFQPDINQMYNRCSYSGHRVLKSDFDNQLLYRVTENLIRTGTEEFLCGMARGFDLAAGLCVVDLKKQYSVRLVACIPCLTQSESFSKKDRELYEKVLENCDEKVILSENYYRGCMQVRNRYLVENCDALICYLREDSGGTFYTVKYAEELGKKIVKL